MDIMQSLGHTIHRPFPPPEKKWIMQQTWSNLLFVHFPVSINSLKEVVPRSLSIDTYKEVAWVSLVLFTIENISFKNFRMFTLIPSFAEMNIRTYVTYKGKPGVYFISCDAGNRFVCNVVKRWYSINFYFAKNILININHNNQLFFKSSRMDKNTNDQNIEALYQPTSSVISHAKKGTLDYFLTERYCLFSCNIKNDLFIGNIHHDQWPLQPAYAELNTPEIQISNDVYIPVSPTKLHYVKRMDALFWNIEKL
jgi:uncharacterized protein